jgi:ABC-2 type transport system permease protein
VIADVLTVAWKEIKELFALGGNLKGGRVGMIIMVGVFGVFLPLHTGAEWVTSPVTVGYWAWVPLMLVTGLIADSFAGERERHTLETLLASRLPDRAILFGKVAAAIAYGWGYMLVMFLCGLVTVNVAYREGGLLLYSGAFTAAALLGGILTAGLAASAGVLISLRASTVRQAAQTLSIGIMLCIFVPAFGLPALPASWKASFLRAAVKLSVREWVVLVCAVLALADAVLLMAAVVRFKRARLILD